MGLAVLKKVHHHHLVGFEHRLYCERNFLSPRSRPALTVLLCSVCGWEQSVKCCLGRTRADGLQSLVSGDLWSLVAPLLGFLSGVFLSHTPIARASWVNEKLCFAMGMVIKAKKKKEKKRKMLHYLQYFESREQRPLKSAMI